MRKKIFHFLPIIIFIFICSSASAQQLIYQPVNPSFGGSPLNGNWMLAQAQAQDKLTDGGQEASLDPFSDFQANLNRQILSQLSRRIVDQIFGESDLTEGTFEIGNFIIDINQGVDGLSLRLFDTLTGNETTIIIPTIN